VGVYMGRRVVARWGFNCGNWGTGRMLARCETGNLLGWSGKEGNPWTFKRLTKRNGNGKGCLMLEVCRCSTGPLTGA
jgi:hypothetical protein